MHLLNHATLVEIHQTGNTVELKERPEYEGRVEMHCKFWWKRQVFHGDFVGFETKLISKAFFSNSI